MTFKHVFRGFFFVLFFLFNVNCNAEALLKPWNIDAKNSYINFSIIQDKSPITGTFKSFTGEINADPDRLNDSHIKIIVDMNSVSTSFKEVAINLKTPDWFDVKIFPNAIFTSTKLTKTGAKSYQAKGTLTVRDKTIPVVLNFVLENYSPTEALVKGSGIVKRTALGLAKGEWAKTDSLKDDVTVDFALSVKR